MKNKRGITLISLVVTVIVLMILAGLTLTLALSKSGILTKAQYAKEASTNAQIQEGTELNDIDNEIADKTNSTETKPVINNKYDYTGSVQQFTVPYSGTYKLEVWGAQGGNAGYNGSVGTYGTYGGLGGYSVGNITLTQGQQIYIYVGGQGTSDNNTGNYNQLLGGYNGRRIWI